MSSTKQSSSPKAASQPNLSQAPLAHSNSDSDSQKSKLSDLKTNMSKLSTGMNDLVKKVGGEVTSIFKPKEEDKKPKAKAKKKKKKKQQKKFLIGDEESEEEEVDEKVDEDEVVEEKREEVKEEVKESGQLKQKKQSSDDFEHEISLDLEHKEDKEEVEFDTGGDDEEQEKVDEEKIKEAAPTDPDFVEPEKKAMNFLQANGSKICDMSKELEEVKYRERKGTKLDVSSLKIGEKLEILELNYCFARAEKPIHNSFFLKMISKTATFALVLESGFLLKCEFNESVPKIGTINAIFDLKRLFKMDNKRDKKGEVECRLHFINEEMDPFKPPEIQIFHIDRHMFEGFREMVKFQLKGVNNTKVIYEVIE